jgi:enoyl-CoA hydratase
MAAPAVLELERDGPVATLWLDRAEVLNAMGRAFWAELPVAMASLAQDADVRAVVVAARGAHFSTGLDLKEMADVLREPGEGGAHAPEAAGPTARSHAARSAALRSVILRMQAAVTSVADCPKPVIAAVHGYCIGGGMDLATACDVRLASADARFSVRETRLAMVADLGTLQRLPSIVGSGHVAELAFTGRDVTAARAKEIGLVNEVFADCDAVLGAARNLAAEIAALSPLAVQGTKAVLRASAGRTVAEGLDYAAAWNAAMLESDDLVEAVAAFLEKRPARFTGR